MRRITAMPESIITAAAASIPQETTVIIPAALKWTWGALGVAGTAIIRVFWVFFGWKRETDATIKTLETKHDNDMRFWFEHCPKIHKDDYEKWEKRLDRVEDNLKEEMSNGFKGIENLINVAIKK